MKKNKIKLGLASGLIGLIALSSCSSNPTYSKDSIMEIKDYNGNVVKISTDTIHDKYSKTSTGIASYYNAILETLIRFQYKNTKFSGWTQGEKLSKSYSEIESLAKNKVEADKTTASTNAKTNNTSYDVEWQKILDSNKVEDEAGLLQHYIYQYEKEEMETWYYKNNEEELLKQYLGVDKDYNLVDTSKVGNINSMFPYHIRHILIKTAGSKSNFTRDVITADEANKLYQVVADLTKKDADVSFGQVAYDRSDDTSKSSYGDVGIVTPETSFVNEFKLGVYAFDAVTSGLNSQSDSNKKIYDAFGLNGTIKNSTFDGTKTIEETLKEDKDLSLSYVPAAVFDCLYESKDKSNSGSEAFFPRNILWNQYLNVHNVFLITDETFDGKSYKDNKHFEKFGDHNILVDSQHRPILGVRSEYGIHFMVMEKSIFKNTNELTGKEGKYTANLVDYYMTDVDKAMGLKDTSVTYITANNRDDTRANYSTRAKTIKDAVKAFDKTYDYRLYEALKGDNITVTFKDSTLEKNIASYITTKRDSNKQSSADTINSSWRTYLELLQLQKESRVDYEPATEEDLHVKYINQSGDPEQIPEGATKPSSSLGENGNVVWATTKDMVINCLFIKTNGEWTPKYTITGHNFTVSDKDPTTESKAIGDIYLNKTNMRLYTSKTATSTVLSDWNLVEVLGGYKGSLVSDVCRQTFGTNDENWQIGGVCYNGK